MGMIPSTSMVNQARPSADNHGARAWRVLSHCSRPAFTLLELVIVISIIAISAAVAVPRFTSTVTRHRAEHAAQRLMADLSLARETAMHGSTSITVDFDTRSATYTIHNVPDVNHPGTPDYTIRLSESPYFAKISSYDLGGDKQLVFDGFGVPDSAAAITLSIGNMSRAVIVSDVSGEISISTP